MKLTFIRAILPILIMANLSFSGCTNKQTGTISSQVETTPVQDSSLWQSNYVRIAPADLTDNMIEVIGKQWMLVTAGNPQSFNTMTAGWGATGFIWGKPAAFIMVRDSRYTYEFIEREQAYTLSFFNEEYKHALNICGTRSGRACDKVKEAGLTPVVTPSGMMAFAEARLIIECRNMFEQRMDTALLNPAYKDEILRSYYTRDEAIHQLYISEITNVWTKK